MALGFLAVAIVFSISATATAVNGNDIHPRLIMRRLQITSAADVLSFSAQREEGHGKDEVVHAKLHQFGANASPGIRETLTESRSGVHETRGENPSSQSQEIDIGFGDTHHYSGRGSRPSLIRPELARFEQCLATDCSECASAANCWHGTRLKLPAFIGKLADLFAGWKLEYLPMVGINVAAGSAFSHYRAVVFTKCPVGSKAYWQLGFPFKWQDRKWSKLANGYLVITKNNMFAKKISRPQKWTAWMKPGSNKLEIDFHPIDRTKPAQAKVIYGARKVDSKFEGCLDTKNCLRVFGDGSDAGFAMRNVNENQLDCLEGKPMPTFLKSKCNEWMTCLKSGGGANEKIAKSVMQTSMEQKEEKGGMAWGSRRRRSPSPSLSPSTTTSSYQTPLGENNQVEFLKTILRAAGTRMKRKTLVQQTRVDRLQEAMKAEACIDPAIEDAEAIECECMDQLVDVCKGVNETCFVKMFCGNGKVCQEWKDENCDASLVERSSTETLGARANKNQGTFDESLDGSLSGKCAA